MIITIEQIRKLREQTGAGVMACKQALEEAGGDPRRAAETLRKLGLAKAEKKKGREAKEGLVEAYVHTGGKLAALVKLNCETDFVAKTREFKQLAREIAMQVASMNPSDVEDLLGQVYIRDPKKTIEDLLTEAIAKLGENIKVARFARFEV